MWIDGIRETTVSEFVSGQGVTGAGPAGISEADFTCRRGVLLKADKFPCNEAIFVGGVAVDENNGLILRTGEKVFLPVDQTSKVFVAGSIEGLKFSWSKF